MATSLLTGRPRDESSDDVNACIPPVMKVLHMVPQPPVSIPARRLLKTRVQAARLLVRPVAGLPVPNWADVRHRVTTDVLRERSRRREALC